MGLYERNYLYGMTAAEEIEYAAILEKEKEGMNGFVRKNLYHLYPVGPWPSIP